ncbi:macrosialin [Tachysurus fulvidraco]|uniref:macrosialin n=1 Tax=Tachysurus fulvidraco TaxID=1234273 RepID=UPI001FEFC61E|nr:macrosialin [Tachysurus fulvidraco]
MRHGSARLIVAVFTLATALTLAEEDAGYRKPPASMIPPAPFIPTPASTTMTTAHTNITTTPTSHNTTTAVTTPATTPHHNTTTTTATTPATTPHHNTTTANVTTPATTSHHNTTTANVTTPATTPHHNTTTANVTTVAPITNATIPPTQKPEPTPTTNITVGNYTVQVGKQLCVMLQAAIQVRVNSSKQHMEGTYIVPGDAPSNGTCERNTSSLKINLKEGYISMNFTKNESANVVFVSAVTVSLAYAFKSGELSHLERKIEQVQLFSTAISHSYSCKSESVLLGNDTYLEFSHERMQAFNFTNNQFGSIDLCKADQPNYRVAIGVGIVLLILILIVVVAYLISRRKRTDGYQTL